MSNIIVFIFPILITLIICAHPSLGLRSLENYGGQPKINTCNCVIEAIYALFLQVEGSYQGVSYVPADQVNIETLGVFWTNLSNICNDSPNHGARQTTTRRLTVELETRLEQYETQYLRNEGVDLSNFKLVVKIAINNYKTRVDSKCYIDYDAAPGKTSLDWLYNTRYELENFQPNIQQPANQ